MLENGENPLLLDNQLCFAIYAASRKVIRQYAPMLAEMDVTYTQYLALLVLWEQKSISIKELGQALYLDTGTLTPMLKKMEQKGLLTRNRLAQDERVVMIVLTEKGQSLRNVAYKHLQNLLCSTNLDPDSLNNLRIRLQHLNRQLDECLPLEVEI
jgi:MarR family transcriptional regulator, organic hydroperoxide resistance regulator